MLDTTLYGLPACLLKAEPDFNKKKELWFWQCAYADCTAYKYVLHSFIYDELRWYKLVDGYGLYKYYKTKKKAMKALRKAILSHVHKEIKEAFNG